MHGARRVWHCGLTIREISNQGAHEDLVSSCSGRSCFCILCECWESEGPSQCLHKAVPECISCACVAVVVSGVRLFFPEE